MGILTHILAFVFGGIITFFMYAIILINNDARNETEYRKIIEKQQEEIKFLKKELEEIETEEIFEGGSN